MVSMLMSILAPPFILIAIIIIAAKFWPDEQHPDGIPDVNDAISAFLTPAGLVYAIVFGFAFQEAQGKQRMAHTQLISLVVLVKQIKILMESFSLSPDHRQQIRIFLKDQIIDILQAIVYKKKHRILNDREAEYQRIIRLVKTPPETSDLTDLDTDIQQKLIEQILNLHSKCTDSSQIKIATLSIFQWIFLETLGYIAFFGILMISAQSVSLQITLCMLTVFSISLLCYVLADLDQPHHGWFRIDLKLMIGCLDHLHRDWNIGLGV